MPNFDSGLRALVDVLIELVVDDVPVVPQVLFRRSTPLYRSFCSFRSLAASLNGGVSLDSGWTRGLSVLEPRIRCGRCRHALLD